MGKQVRRSGENVREHIVRNIETHPHDIVTFTAEHFDCTRQAVHAHVKRLVEQGALKRSGPQQKPVYTLARLETFERTYCLTRPTPEDIVFERDLRPLLEALPKNLLDIWSVAFTEMMNNAMDHSSAPEAMVWVERTAAATTMFLQDAGVGIFRKIAGELGLVDERLALLELAKGKFTTDPANHTGQGIFFTSRMMDEFAILSGGLIFTHQRGRERDWLTKREQPRAGTTVVMRLSNHSSRSTKKVYDEFSSKDGDYRFNKTMVPVELARVGEAELVSRSQGKRVMARVDRFEEVILDFRGVEMIGQAFADEVFRVYARAHPAVSLHVVHANAEVRAMIQRAQNETIGAVTSNEAGTAP